MTNEPDFHSLVGNDLDSEDEARLRRAHDLLVAAGPPPELPPDLMSAPAAPSRRGSVRAAPGLPPPKRGRLLALAFALGAVALFAGYLFGARKNSFDTQFSVPMKATAAAPGASAVIDVGKRDESGNWPLRMEVNGLRELPEGSWYELLLTRPGRPNASCGTFRVHSGITAVRLNVPYEFGNRYGWVVKTVRPRRAPSKPLLEVQVRRA